MQVRFDLQSVMQALLLSEPLSTRSAAQQLGLQSSVVSRRIRALEEQLGVTLFERNNAGVRTTDAGRRFLDRARWAMMEPEAARKYVPRYPLVSATLLGRLAVASSPHGQGLGSVLLGSALRKAYASASSVGASMVVVDAIDDRAVGFYEAHGFVRLAGSLRLVMAMQTIGRTQS